MPSQNSEYCDVIVLGAGAAGLMCAIEAGKRGKNVVVFELADKIGKKILISGGGRCNFTNILCKPENFISENPHFAKSALARYQPKDFIALVDKHQIKYHEKTLGQLFCDGSARDIVTMLEAECATAGVNIIVNARVKTVERGEKFDINLTIDGRQHYYSAKSLVVATGGLSIPKMGATGFGYDLARQFGLKIVECRPALVPLTFNEEDHYNWSDLTGVSTEVVASLAPTKVSKNAKPRFREKMLFTHRGLSGPAILQISSYWKQGSAISVDLAPDKKPTEPLMQKISGRDVPAVSHAFRDILPHRLADRWLNLYAPERFTNQGLETMERAIHHWHVTPEGTEGYEKAEVTAGGVSTDELDAKNMQSKKVPGLYFIGEVVDVTGHLGGFNFQWAWASGFSAGQAV
jgi:predicted Rossmann fold flavoprotein